MKNFKVLFTFCLLLTLSEAFGQVVLSASVDNSNPLNLDTIQYTITVTNPSTISPAPGVIVNAVVPRGLKYISDDPDQGSYDPGTGVWNVGTVSPSSSLDLKLNCLVNYFNSAYDVRDYYNYNLLLTNNASLTGSTVGGKLAAGGDISAIGSSIGGLLPTLNPVPVVVNAGGYLNFTSSTIFKGDVVYGDSTNLPSGTVVYPNGTLWQGSPFDFSAYGGNVTSLSSGLSSHTVNGITTFSGGYLSLTGSDIYLNVFSVSGANFSSADSIVISIPKGSIGVINVTGTSLQFIGNVRVVDNLNNMILFNFPSATTIDLIGSHFCGSILAPYATINNTGTFVQGQIFASDLNTISSHDLTNFVGYIPLDRNIYLTVTSPSGSPAVVPLTVNTTPPFGTGGNGSWSLGSLMPDSVWVLSLVRLDSNSVLAGTFAGRIYRLDNNGVRDTLVNASMTPVSAIWDLAVNDSGHIFAATTSGLQRSNDGGVTWTTSLPLLDVRAVLIGQDSNMYAGTWGFGVYKSTDGGYSWTAKNENIGTNVITAMIDKVDTNALSTPHTIFAGGYLKGLSASWDSGENWLPLAMPYEFVTTLAKTSTGILYIGTLTDGVYRSYDNGNSFHKLSGIPSAPVYCIKVDGDNNIFVSSWLNGIYASSDLGDNWTYLGLGGYAVSSLYALPNGSLLVGTRSGQVMKNNSPLTSIQPEDASTVTTFELAQNYPNPFNPSTNIRVAIPYTGNYKLAVYNILGQEVATLFNGTMAQGSYSFTFNAQSFSTGIYIYSLTGNGVNLTKKMMLVK